ncbi:hypothetical protein LTR62_005576 [Meristemomyces frigidus]|uniref:PRA1 family protein n=1 Tax=Meristemomyces frigidus TaxID=1508187 RepID=A0AAN7TCT4_9PEZI|nr:hypothetical protein LTR62_005576 [Meristemomyces frigidus]
MSRINLPLDALTSRFNLQGRFDSVRSQSIANRFANLKPISEFFDIKRIGKPRDFGELQSRANYNLGYFSSNYAVVFVMLSIYSLLTNLLLLFVIVLVVGGMFGISKLQGSDLDLGFLRATSSQLYTALLVLAVPLGIWASPISTVLWLVGASAVTILGHASLLDRPIEASFSEYVETRSHSTMPANLCATGRRFKDRSAAHSSPYDMGRPPRAPNDDGPRGQNWELRNSTGAGRRGDPRFQELDSEEDDGQGVLLDQSGYALRNARQRGFAGDELYFDGYDTVQDRQRRRQGYDYGGEYDSEEEYARRRSSGHGTGGRSEEELLIKSALARIGKARASGKTNVNLSVEEMEALERRQGVQQPEPLPPPPSMALVSPPATPAKIPAKGKSGSRSSSSTSLSAQKTRKKSSISTPSPAKSNSKAKVDRRPSTEQVPTYPPGTPGVMVIGPNGVPVFQPTASYPPLSHEFARAGAGRPRSRSTSKHSRRESTPPEQIDSYGQYGPRYYISSGRPASSSSNRSLQDELEWHTPPPIRARAASNAQYSGYRPTDDYDYASPLPAAQGQQRARNVSGPAVGSPDMRYASLRRVPASSSPLARPDAQHAYSDPPLRSAGSLGRQLERVSSSSSDDQGVQVNIVSDVAGGGYSINRAGGGNGNEARRRKSGRR